MPDLHRTDETPAHLAPGGRFDSRLDVLCDRDWITITLAAGQSVQVDTTGRVAQGLSDPYLRLRDAQGTILFIDDNSGTDLGGRLQFTVPHTGTYYIPSGAFLDDATGDCWITATAIAAPAITPALNWDPHQTESHVTVSFPAPGTMLDGFTAYERGQIIAALDRIAAVTAFDVKVTEAPDADLRLLLDLNDLRGGRGADVIPGGAQDKGTT